MNTAASAPRAVFKFSQLVPVCLAALTTLVICGAIGIASIRGNDVLEGVIFLAISWPFFGIIAVGVALSMSDIVLDDRGISRRIFGIQWKEMGWQDVAMVRVSEVPGFGSVLRKRLTFDIFARTSERGIETRRGITFNDRSVDIQSLVGLLNIYIAAHRIPVETLSPGKRTRGDQITM